jgi:hypothetical protein
MPVTKDPKSGKWRIGRGKPIYRTRAAALRAYRAYLAKRNKRI